MERMHKRVVAMTPDPLQDQTTADLLAGATLIELENTCEFYEDGGSVRIAGTIYTYSEVEEGEDDDTPNPSITLDSGLVADLPAGSIVEAWNPADNGGAGGVATDYVVTVTDDTDGSPAEAYLRHTLIPYLPEGLPPGVGDSVTVEVDEFDTMWVVEVHGRRPGYDPGFIRTGGLGADTVVWAGTENGRRAQLDGIDGALEAFNATNEQTVNIDGEQNYMRGTTATDAPGQPRVEVGQGEAYGFPASEIRFYTDSADETGPGEVSSSVLSASGQDVAVLEIRPAQTASDVSLLRLVSRSALGGVAGQVLLSSDEILLFADGDVSISAGAVSITGGNLDATMGDGSVGTGTFRDSVDARVTAVGAPVTGTTANFDAIGNSRNTTGKYAGRPGWNTSVNRPIWATGSTAASTWVFADGTTAHTPS